MRTPSRRHLLTGAAAALTTTSLATPVFAQAAGPSAHLVPTGPGKRPRRFTGREGELWRWAKDTWASLDAMTDPRTGLVADNIGADLSARSGYTSPTNIGGILWSTLIARELGLLTPGHARQRIARTLRTLARMERHEPSGMYVNWYSEADGSILRTWPEDGKPVVPFVSSVDMGWLGAALYVVAQADPSNRKAARRLFEAMRWDVFFNRDFARSPGATMGGFWLEDPRRADAELRPPLNDVGGPDLWYHVGHHYDTAISEARMVTYLGIVRSQIPAGAYFSTYRTFPPEWDWPEMPVSGTWETYEGVEVFEGAHEYRGMRIVPGWGGSMFEELMPDLFVPEAEWGPTSWGLNHPLHVRAQREHGLDEAGYGYWGFSPCSNPAGGYREYGVDALGLNPEGYFSDQEETNWRWDAPPTHYGDGVVTPHAAALALQYEPDEAYDNLAHMERELGAYGPGGFFDAIAVGSGQIARRHLSLDQAMTMGALGNVLLDGQLRRWFATPEVAAALAPVIGQERFSAAG